jgi:anaerobic selenocysteine-containing dehydrogenase
LIQPFTPERVSEITGLSQEAIVETAREFATQGPAIALGGGDAGGGPLGREEEVAIWSLNLLVGSVGRRGGVVPRRVLPEPMGSSEDAGVGALTIDALPDRTIRVLILDGAPSGSSLPWSVLKNKLVARDALVVSLSPYLVGHALHADCVVPAPAYLEAVEEAPSPPGAARASLALSASLLPVPAGVTDAVELIVRTASAMERPFSEPLSSSSLIEKRLRALHEIGRGHLFHCATGELEPVEKVPSPEVFVRHLYDGACWIDAESEIPPIPRFRLLGREADGFERLAALANGRPIRAASSAPSYPLVLMPFGLKGIAGGGPVTGLTSKLYRESRLRPEPRFVLLNPETGRACGLRDGGRARVETPRGVMEVRVRFDSLVRPGVLHAPVGPDPDQLGEGGRGQMDDLIDLCESVDRRVWRVVPASIREA